MEVTPGDMRDLALEAARFREERDAMSKQLADARKWAHKAIVSRTDDDMFDAMYAIQEGKPFV